LYKFHSSDDESQMPTELCKNVIDFNVISVHVTKEGKREFVIVEFLIGMVPKIL
jgi:hypothetical protein